MRVHVFIILLFLNYFFGWSQYKWEPPVTDRKSDTLYFGGNMVVDEYAYLEKYKDPEITEWYKSQADYTNSLLDRISGQDLILNEFSKIEKVIAPNLSQVQRTSNGSYFYLRSEPDRRPGRVYIKSGDAELARVLFDPITYKPDQGYFIRNIAPSHAGTKLAILLYPKSGQEEGELIVLDLKKGSEIIDTLTNVKGQPVSWIDETSFFITKFPKEKVVEGQVFVHNTEDQENDKLFFSAAKFPELGIKPEENPHIVFYPEQELFIANVYTTLGFFRSFLKDEDQWIPINSIEDMVTDIKVTEEGIYYKSAKNASNFRILKASLDHPSFEHASEEISEPKVGVITNFAAVKEGIFYVIKVNGVESKLFFKGFKNHNVEEVKLPVSPANIQVKSIRESNELELAVSGWTTPGRRYVYNYENGIMGNLELIQTSSIPEMESLIIEEISVPSHDQTMVPVSLIYDNKIKKDSKNIVFMTVYGAYGQNNGPDYIPQLLGLTNLGIIVCFPHIRGGGELGEGWHRAGQKDLKYNSWKDVIASAEYLIQNGYTNAEKIILQGGSAGAIAVGMAVNERPELFGAVMNEVGAVSLMNKYELPTAKINNHEFGDVNDPDEFEIVRAMNPYSNLKKGTKYPATLVSAGFNDPRILPYVPAKYFAKLQAANGSDNPILFSVDFSQGHGASTYEDFKKSFSRKLSFALWQTGHVSFRLENN